MVWLTKTHVTQKVFRNSCGLANQEEVGFALYIFSGKTLLTIIPNGKPKMSETAALQISNDSDYTETPQSAKRFTSVYGGDKCVCVSG